ncbi:MAG: hypothetical protein J5779_00900 [Clostridia bacterium]|nr:hypothetical protein [Clostridia bacterium]
MFFLFAPPPLTTSAETLTPGGQQYARVKHATVNLYRTPSEDETYKNIYFTIPETYFVELLSYENDKFFYARYLDVYGYVKISDVSCVAGTPINPFAANVSFRVFIPNGVDMRSSPSQSDGLNYVASVNYLETNLQYYGKILGEEAVVYKGNDWYYCKLTKNSTEQKGYIYSAYCDMLTSIPQNTEILEYIDEPNFNTKQTSAEAETVDSSISAFPISTQIIIIAAICVPCILLIYLIFKPTRLSTKAYQNAERKFSKKRGKKQDYYEFDE